jgi:NAD(P)-dependent dehydrogenase (short-subunit alcohol dehydrogenase family)
MHILDGKVGIITGGCGMLGTEYARALSAAGAAVFLLDVLPRKKIDAHIKKHAEEFRGNVFGVHVDITDEKSVRDAVAHISRERGRVDILINNAALTDVSGKKNRFAPYEDFPLDLWREELDVSLTGAFIATKAVIPYMKEQTSGVIVNVASIYGIVGADNRIYEKGKYRSIAYSAAKSGILNFTRALASYLAPHGVRVNTLTLGGVFDGHDRRFVREYSKRAMLARMMSREEVRGPMLFLCSDASSYMTGANLILDGGWSAW